LQADKSAFKAKRLGSTKSKIGLTRNKSKKDEMNVNVENIDFNKKILHAAWHPQENSIAVAATNNLFLFSTL
jgi:serine/threonine-protein phosphatase 2A regulatory subunit B